VIATLRSCGFEDGAAGRAARYLDAEYQAAWRDGRTFRLPAVAMLRAFCCPNCGHRGAPAEVVRCAEQIVFYNCRACDFSTWDLREFRPLDTLALAEVTA
jgi:predicted RNA-binding Zn-ribbon protein involved in translation (DUF1610 family)